MSLEQACLRFGGRDSHHYHRAYSNGDLRGIQYTNPFQNGNNFEMNLNHLLASVSDEDVAQYNLQQQQQQQQLHHLGQHQQYVQYEQQQRERQQMAANLRSIMDFDTYSSPSPNLHHFSPVQAPPAPPNSAYSSPANLLPQSRDHFGVRQTPSSSSSSRNLFPSFTSAPCLPSLPSTNRPVKEPESQLGLDGILRRLDGLGQNNSLIPQAPISRPISRGSTPLPWNPLGLSGGMQATPYSSLTPSPTLQPTSALPPTNVRGLMDQKLEEDFASFTSPPEVEETKRVSPSCTTQQFQDRAMHEKMQMAVRGIAKLQVQTKPATERSAGSTSWSQIVRSNSSSRLPQVSPPQLQRPKSPASPDPPRKEQTVTSAATSCPSNGMPDYHRGPKVDPRWPVAQQVFLGPIPMSISWDEIRNVFYTKVSRKELLHFYVQSKPVNEVVYGQVVFDKVTLANKILKEGPIKVRGQYITMTPMGEKMKQMKLEKKK